MKKQEKDIIKPRNLKAFGQDKIQDLKNVLLKNK